MDTLAIIFLKGAVAAVAIFLSFWLISLLTKNPSIIDVCWGLGFILIAFVYIVSGAGWTLRNLMLLSAIAFWGLRISYFVLKRLNFGKTEDHRYIKIREQWKPYVKFNFLVFFLVQAGIEILMSLPFLFIAINDSASVSTFEIIGIIICLFAIIGETIADEQLEFFKRHPDNKGKVCNIGLWNYSRHPNYFFEFLTWFGFYVFACGSSYGWLTFISPSIILHFILNVSGIPLAEKLSLERRGDAYREYQKTTSKFIPLPKRAL